MEIGVIGGGAAAVCLIDALSQSDCPIDGITIFEPAPRLWRGRPYQADLDVVRVNAPPEDMSVRDGDLKHFSRWLDARADHDTSAYLRPDASGTRFAPRAVYGDYLEETARGALATLRARGWRVTVVRAGVAAALRTTTRAVLRTTHGTHHAVDYAVLCVGGARPSDAYGLAGAPGFIGDPYPVRRTLAVVGRDQRVAVIGSGLTAVDVVVTLRILGHRGAISLVSRQGVLPGVRQRPVDYHLRHFSPQRLREWGRRQDPVTLDQLVDLMRAELAEAGEDVDALAREIASVGVEPPVARLRRHVAEVDAPTLGVRILQRAVPDTGPDVWPLLSESDKARILRSHYRTIMSLCCPMPPVNGEALLSMIDAGQLDIAANLRCVAPRSAGGFDVVTADRAFTADVVVNAVNAPAHKIPEAAEPLVRSLVTGGIAARHPHGGLHVERATSRLTADGEPDARLYALGDLAAGSLFFTFGIPSLVDRARDIVAAIAEDRATAGRPRLAAAA